MTSEMNGTEMKQVPISPEALAHLGDGEIAYVKAIRSEDVATLFPQVPEIQPGLILAASASTSKARDALDRSSGMSHQTRVPAIPLRSTPQAWDSSSTTRSPQPPRRSGSGGST